MTGAIKIIIFSIILAAACGTIPRLVPGLAETHATVEHAAGVDQLKKEKRISASDYHRLKESERNLLKEVEFYTERKITADIVVNPALTLLLSIIWFETGKISRKNSPNKSYMLFLTPVVILAFGYEYQPYIHSAAFLFGWYAHYRENTSVN